MSNQSACYIERPDNRNKLLSTSFHFCYLRRTSSTHIRRLSTMHLEISAAVDFLAQFVESSSRSGVTNADHSSGSVSATSTSSSASPSTTSATAFRKHLTTLLMEKYQNHWHASDPRQGNAYRALTFHAGHIDPLVVKACRRAAGDNHHHHHSMITHLRKNRHLQAIECLWVDPGCVSVSVLGDRHSLTRVVYDVRTDASAAAAAAIGRPLSSSSITSSSSSPSSSSSSSSSSIATSEPAHTSIHVRRVRQPILIKQPASSTTMPRKRSTSASSQAQTNVVVAPVADGSATGRGRRW